jgi:tubulin polyglutamylase TTLL5
MHLTNYSINKKSEKFVQTNNLQNDDAGNKWSLEAFCQYLELANTDMHLFWGQIYDVILKSFLSCEPAIYQATKQNCLYNSNSFELFGYDILIDSKLKPWLVEVNLSPSLACESELDLHIKSQLIAETLNLVGLHSFDRSEKDQQTKNRMKSY